MGPKSCSDLVLESLTACYLRQADAAVAGNIWGMTVVQKLSARCCRERWCFGTTHDVQQMGSANGRHLVLRKHSFGIAISYGTVRNTTLSHYWPDLVTCAFH